VVSIDKDMAQIPGWHVNPTKDDFPRWVSEEEADYFLALQWLTGDSTDGIPGLPGIGPKKAEKLLGGLRAPGNPIQKALDVWRGWGAKWNLPHEKIWAQLQSQAHLVEILRWKHAAKAHLCPDYQAPPGPQWALDEEDVRVLFGRHEIDQVGESTQSPPAGVVIGGEELT
jgi:5'-3' exonuclease